MLREPRQKGETPQLSELVHCVPRRYAYLQSGEASQAALHASAVREAKAVGDRNGGDEPEPSYSRLLDQFHRNPAGEKQDRRVLILAKSPELPASW